MLLTELEAKEKWCPFVRAASPLMTPHNRHIEYEEGKLFGPLSLNPPACRCIASQCMAWTWWQGNMPAGPGAENYNVPPRGFCGLAGRPSP